MKTAIDTIVAVLIDPHRTDRYLRRSDDGAYYTTPDRTWLSDGGVYGPPYVTIPICQEEVDDEQLVEIAEGLIEDLDGRAADEDGRRESAISREHARHLLADLGREQEWDAMGDYWIVTQAGGAEELWMQDDCLATNPTTLSWLGSWPSRWSDERFAERVTTPGVEP